MKKRKDISNIYLWFDTEFTTLDLENARLLQVALIMTDSSLERIAGPEDDINLFVKLGTGVEPSGWVRENLSDLLEYCRSDSALPLDEINRRIAAWLEEHLGKQREDISDRPLLAGNSLCCDWYLARRFLPSLSEFTNYRILDVSGWKMHCSNAGWVKKFNKTDTELVRKYFPGELNGTGKCHDAYYDVQASIAEFNYYIQQVAPVDQ